MRVLVVDDHQAVLTGVARLVESEAPCMRIAGLARSGCEALRLARDAHPDVILLDVMLDGENGLDLLPELVAASGAAIVILSSVNDARLCARARGLGVKHCVNKLAPAGELLAAIKMAFAANAALNH